MASKMKIVIIGAGSREFSRGLVHDLVLERALFESRELTVVMVDVDAQRLELMCGYARRCATAMKVPIAFQATMDRR